LVEVVDFYLLAFVVIDFEHVIVQRRLMLIGLGSVDARDPGAVPLVVFLYLVDLHNFHVFLHGL
jgi:hypothetical protein